MIPDQHHLRHESAYVRLLQINATIGVVALLFRQPANCGHMATPIGRHSNGCFAHGSSHEATWNYFAENTSRGACPNILRTSWQKQIGCCSGK
jgi:hypothetical protein